MANVAEKSGDQVFRFHRCRWLFRQASMMRLLSWLGLLAALGFAAYFTYFAIQVFSWKSLSAVLHGSSVLAILGASMIYVLVIPFAGWAWSRLLADMGVKWSWGRTSAVIGVTQIAKYVPGNVAQHLGRAALALARNMPPDVFAGSVLLETLLVMGAALLVGCLGWLCAMGPGLAGSGVLGQTLGLTLLVLGLAIPACVVLLRVLRSLRRKSEWVGKWISEDLRFPGLGAVCQAALAYALNFLVLGLSLWLLCATLSPAARFDYLYLTAAFAFAWLAGFMAPGLPAGLGAREGVLGIFLSGYLPEAELLNVLLGMRLATMGGDLLSFGLGLGLARIHLRPVVAFQD